MPAEKDSDSPTAGAGSREPDGFLARWRRRARSQRVIVHDHSMEPTFLPGDRLLVDPSAYRLVPIARGDLVVVADPTASDRWLLKRVVGVAGDFVRITRAGIERVAQPLPTGAPTPEGALEELEVPSNHVFVLSDRAQHTRDSRQFGPVPVAAVLGRVWSRTAPAARAGRI
jgi:signal peptidase I